jgi:phage shock protein E
MLQAIKNRLRFGAKTDYSTLVKQGAIILDVRSNDEFSEGHIINAINIPVREIRNHLSELDQNKPFICCCGSGVRSGAAKTILESKGFRSVYDGGKWMELIHKL